MSIEKQINTYVSTGRGFLPPGNTIQNIAGSLLTKKTFTITDAQLEDNSYLLTAFENLDIIPLHLVQSVINNDQETQIQQSIQDFPYELSPGKFKHTLRFDWDIAFHQIVETYSGSDLYIIEYDQVGNLILAESGTTGVYRGVKTDGLILQKTKLHGNGSDIAYSDLNVELKNGETLKIIQVDWLPDSIDKLFVSINLLNVSADTINFSVKYNSDSIETISASDVSVVDNASGDLVPSVFNVTDGIYQASNFTAPLTTGKLIINSALYLGCIKYIYRIVVDVTVGFDLLDGTGFDLLDGSEFDLLVVTA